MTTLEKVIEEIKALTPAELKQVRQAIEELLRPPHAQMTEDEFEQHLAAKGIITLPRPLTAEELASRQAEFDAYKPIEVRGTPLSQMIIKERR